MLIKAWKQKQNKSQLIDLNLVSHWMAGQLSWPSLDPILSDGHIYCSVLRDHILPLRGACVCVCVWWHHSPVVKLRVCCFEALRLLSWKKQSVLHRLANGAEKCHKTQTLLYRCFSVRRAFLFQVWAGSSAFSSLNAYLVFSQQILSKDCVAAAALRD